MMALSLLSLIFHRAAAERTVLPVADVVTHTKSKILFLAISTSNRRLYSRLNSVALDFYTQHETYQLSYMHVMKSFTYLYKAMVHKPPSRPPRLLTIHFFYIS